MKKAICYIMSVIMLLALVSCGDAKDNKTNQPTELPAQTPQPSNPSEMDNKFAFSASSLQDFVEKMSGSGTQTQSLSQNSLFVEAANNKNLSFKNYDVFSVFCTPGQTDEGTLNGNISLEVYFHEVGCKFCSLGGCTKFDVYLCYVQKGVDQAGILRGSEPTEDENIYVYNAGDRMGYTYLINNQYFCWYHIKNEVPDQKAVADQLKKFCREIQSSLKNDTTVK